MKNVKIKHKKGNLHEDSWEWLLFVIKSKHKNLCPHQVALCRNFFPFSIIPVSSKRNQLNCRERTHETCIQKCLRFKRLELSNSRSVEATTRTVYWFVADKLCHILTLNERVYTQWWYKHNLYNKFDKWDRTIEPAEKIISFNLS